MLIVLFVFFTEIGRLPRKKWIDVQDAKIAFTQCYDAIDKILEPYGISTQLYREENVDYHDSLYRYSVSANVPLTNDNSLQIELNSRAGSLPRYHLSLKSNWNTEIKDCYFNIEDDYRYVFEIASYLCDQQYSADSLKNSSKKLEEKLEKSLKSNYTKSGEIESIDLKGLFIKLGSLEYIIDKEEENFEEKYQANINIYNYLYLK